jgi:hypothetical protein
VAQLLSFNSFSAVFFAALWHNYDNEGIIKVGIIKPKFINKLLNNKD